MFPRWFRSGTGSDQRSWPTLLLLLGVVIVPTVCVLWFMFAAMENERDAVRQRLTAAYRAQLVGIKTQLAARLQQQVAGLDTRSAELSCAGLFAAVVREGAADSLICHGATDRADYPGPPPLPPSEAAAPAAGWHKAARLERQRAYEQAAAAFSRINVASADVHLAARALQAQARCLSQAERKDAALEVLIDELGQPRYRAATDSRGRLIAPSARLLALQLIDDPGDETFRRVAGALAQRLVDYNDPVLPSPQRRFLMRELRETWPEAPAFDTFEAEQLAIRFLESEMPASPPSVLTRTDLDAVWQLASPTGEVVTLHTREALLERLGQIVDQADLPAESRAELLTPGRTADPASLFVSFAADDPLPGWRLALNFDEQALADAAAGRQITIYLWTGVLVIALIVAAAGLIARLIGRQMRLTRLKNDLLATVTHELKTPLASMRLLVDTLLEGPPQEARRVREYLELVSKENNRLSRLVDNFLSFSRMERNKQQFERRQITAASVVRCATAAVSERFETPACRLQVEIAPDLPQIYADPDALVTVILNLLDNAYKYSNEEKQIALRAYSDNGHVCFAVRDNGIGLSSRARRKVFERFYQVDQSLSRSGNGCGLGLAIVRFIIDAHDGSVEVASQPGQGSTFTVRLPAVQESRLSEAGPARQEAAGD